MLHIFWRDETLRFYFQDQFLCIVPDHKVHSPLGNNHSIKNNRDFYFSLEMQTFSGKRNSQSALVVNLFTVKPQLALYLNTGADHIVGKLFKTIAF